MRLILVLLFSMPAPLAAQEASSEPSLVELVRKQKERKKSAQKKSRMITNADLRKFRSARIATTAVTRSADSADITQSDAKSDTSGAQAQVREDRGDDVEFWKSALAEAQLDVKRLVNRGLVLQLKMNNLQNAFFIEADGTTQAMLQGQLNETLQEIAQNKESIEKAKKELAKLRREARKSGVPGGIIREYR